MVSLDSIPAELTRPGRALPSWAPGITYLMTTTLLVVIFIAGPGVGAILAGVLADVPMKVKAIAIAAGILIVALAVVFVAAVVRRRRIYKRGSLVAATIETRREQIIKASGIRTRVWRYEYTFAGPAGSVRGRSKLDLLGERQLGFVPDVGDTVFVAFDPSRPRRSYAWSYARDHVPLRVPGMK